MVTEGAGDLWHVDYIGLPVVIPMPTNVAVSATDGSVDISWEAPSGGESYSNEWVYFDDGGFENSIIFGVGGQGYLGNMFSMPFGVESLTLHSARVHASGTGTTTLAAFTVGNDGNPSPTSLYSTAFTTVDDNFTGEISLDWAFQGSFVLAMLVTDQIGLSIDMSATPSENSWSNAGGWARWVEVAASNENVSDGEFGIQAKVTTVGGSTPLFNVYRNPGLGDAPMYTIIRTNMAGTSFTDGSVTNGVEYCYRVHSDYDGEFSELTVPECVTPISSSVYEVAYDDGTHDHLLPVGQGNFLAQRFTPDGYPSELYSSRFYLPNAQSGTVQIYVWKDDGVGGLPGTVLVPGLPMTMIQGWNSINFANAGLSINIESGSVYVGYRQPGTVNFEMGIDWDNASNTSNSIIDFGIGQGWQPLNTYSPGGVWMIRAQIDGENVTASLDDINSQLPEVFTLSQNYPNPFNPSTNIRFGISENSDVTIEVFNILGESVRSISTLNMTQGRYEINLSMDELASGMYFYRLTAIGKPRRVYDYEI